MPGFLTLSLSALSNIYVYCCSAGHNDANAVSSAIFNYCFCKQVNHALMLPINAAIAPNRSCDRIKVTANTATDLMFNQFKVKIFGIEIALTVKSAISLKI